VKQSDFYAREEVQPFRRDLSDRRRYFEQRDSLLRQLGIVPRLLRGARILEIGPGHGENALYLQQQGPRELVLVEISDECARACSELLGAHALPGTRVEVQRRSFDVGEAGEAGEADGAGDGFHAREPFDLVVFEGVIPFEPDPEELLARTARFVAPGGVLSITCIDSVSLFSEALRRLVGLVVAPSDLSSAERVARLVPLFGPHLESLAGMTRSHEHWVLDQMIHPWSGRQLSILEAARAIAPDFDLYGVAPDFLTDWRWFRDVHGERGYLERAEGAYLANVHNLIDHRYARAPREAAENRSLLGRCDAVLEAVRSFEGSADPRELDRVAFEVEAIAGELADLAPETVDALRAFPPALAACRAGRPADFGPFASLFGRGQQYASFLRNPFGARTEALSERAGAAEAVA